MADEQIHWRGWARWLAFVLAGLLILVAIPMIFDRASGAVAGWNIFLGLLLAGAIGSGYRRADRITIFVAVLMCSRLVTGRWLLPLQAALLWDLLFAVLACAIAYDIRRQARLI